MDQESEEQETEEQPMPKEVKGKPVHRFTTVFLSV